MNDPIYQSERWDDVAYEIPVAIGRYSITLHFAEIWFTTSQSRVCNVVIDDCPSPFLATNYDIIAAAGPLSKYTISIPCTIVDGFLSIRLLRVVDNPKISGIEFIFTDPHLAHSVPDISGDAGSFAVDTDNNQEEAVPVDGSNSHTHAPDKALVSYQWTAEDNILLGTGVKPNLLHGV
jgi:Malectin domain